MATRGMANHSGGESDIAARAAWLHFIGGLTQSEVAKRLGVPMSRAHRYIARAQNEGLVKVFVEVEAADCVVLETELMKKFGLQICRVAMDLPEPGPLPLRALSAIGAEYLMDATERGQHQVIGVGHGRTLSASVDAMGRVEAGSVRFVSVLGGLTRSFAANPYDVIHRLAQKTGAEAYMLPVPMFANSAADKKVLRGQPGLDTIMGLIEKATLLVVGIGEVRSTTGGMFASLASGLGRSESNLLEQAESEILGQFLNADGDVLHSIGRDRVMAPPLEDLKSKEVVAIAGGLSKAKAIEATLKGGFLTGLIIDEATARVIVGDSAQTSSP